MDQDLTLASCYRWSRVMRTIVENPARPLQPLGFTNRGSVYRGTGFHVQTSMAAGADGRLSSRPALYGRTFRVSVARHHRIL